MNKHNKQIQNMDLSSVVETIESLDKRIKDIDTKLAIVVESLRLLTTLFEEISSDQIRLYENVEYNMGTLTNNIAYLEDVGDGEVY